jgi:hypothetical protein
LPRTSAALSAATISVLSRATIGGGSPAGPRKPNHDEGLRKAGMTSDIDGICGSLPKRAGSSTARIFARPSCITGMA